MTRLLRGGIWNKSPPFEEYVAHLGHQLSEKFFIRCDSYLNNYLVIYCATNFKEWGILSPTADLEKQA